MKALVPLVIALVGLGAGVGAGFALKPKPPEEIACAAPAGGHAVAADTGGEGHGAAAPAEGAGATPAAVEPVASTPCAAEQDPLAPQAKHPAKKTAELAYVPMEKPFVVPIFKGEKIAAMVVVSLSVETDAEGAPRVEGVQPRLRDSFLKVMFRHANSGGFNGSFTMGPKMDDLKSALLSAAREVMEETPVDEVLITEIARQDS